MNCRTVHHSQILILLSEPIARSTRHRAADPGGLRNSANGSNSKLLRRFVSRVPPLAAPTMRVFINEASMPVICAPTHRGFVSHVATF